MRQGCFKALMFVAIAFSIGNYACAMEHYVHEDKNLHGYVLSVIKRPEVTLDDVIKLLGDAKRPIVHAKIKWQNLGDDEVAQLAHMLCNNELLRSLDIGHNAIKVVGVVALAKMLEHNTSLISLNMESNKIEAAGLKALLGALKKNQVLKTLVLHGNFIGSIGVEAFAEIIKHNKLSSLDLSANGMRATGAAIIANAMKNNNVLTALSFENNKIGSAGAKPFAEMLEQNTSLVSLNLFMNLIESDGIVVLANALRKNNSLTSLNVGANHVDSAGEQAFAEMLEDNTTLTELVMTQSIMAISNKKIDAALERNRLLKDLLPVVAHSMRTGMDTTLYEQLDPMPMDLIKIIMTYVPISSTADLLKLIMNGTIDQYVDAVTLQANQATIQKIKELHVAVKPQTMQPATHVFSGSSASSSSVNTGVSSGSTSSATSGLACSCRGTVAQAAS